jgi:hypothetical protein
VQHRVLSSIVTDKTTSDRVPIDSRAPFILSRRSVPNEPEEAGLAHNILEPMKDLLAPVANHCHKSLLMADLVKCKLGSNSSIKF